MKNDKDQIRKEYSSELIKSGTRGKHAARYREGTNIVLIDSDLLKVFPDSEAVNKALRDYLSQRQPSA